MKFLKALFGACLWSMIALGVRKPPPPKPKEVQESLADHVEKSNLVDLLSGYSLPKVLQELFFSGEVEKKEDSIAVLRGSLQAQKNKSIVLMGLVFDRMKLHFNKRSKELLLTGVQKVADCAVTVSYSISLKKPGKLEVSCRLANSQLLSEDIWQPKRINTYLVQYLDQKVLPASIGLRNIAVRPIMRPKKNLKKTIDNLIFLDEKANKKLVFDLDDLVLNEAAIIPVIFGSWEYEGSRYEAAICPLNEDFSKEFFIAKTNDSWSLAQGVPKVFGVADDTSVMGRVRNFLGRVLLDGATIVISPNVDDLWNIAQGLRVQGTTNFVSNVQEDPVLRVLTKQNNSLPVYLDQTGPRGLDATMLFECDPQKTEESYLKMQVNTNDSGVFFRMHNKDPYGVKNIVADTTFNPFALTGSADCRFSYFGMENAMQASVKVAADSDGLGIVVSGAGDEDLTKLLEFFLGTPLIGLLGQKIILQDLAFELRESWPALLGALPTAGLSLAALSSFGLSGGVIVGPEKNPLQARCKLRGGLDKRSWLFELFYEQKSGWLPLFFFLLDVYWHVLTLGQKDAIAGELLDMKRIQAFVENLFPLLLDGFYLRFVPTSGSMGKIKLPYGVGGNIQMRSFGNEVGADLWIDSQGARAVAFVDPFDWGIVSLFPSVYRGPAFEQIQAGYNSLDAVGITRSEWRKSKEKKIAVELFANENGWRIGSNVGLSIADVFVGKLSGFYSSHGVDLNGQVSLEKLGALSRLDGAKDLFTLSIKGHSKNPDLALNSKKALSEIMLDVDFTNAFTTELQRAVAQAFDSVKDVVVSAAESIIAGVLEQTGQDELQQLRAERDRVCSEKGLLGVVKDPITCGVLTSRVALLEGKNLTLDNLEKLAHVPSQVRTALQTLVKMGIRVLDNGGLAFDTLAQTFVIERVWWHGSLADFSQGLLRGVTLEAKIFGIPVVAHDLTFDLFSPAKSFFAWITDVVRVVRNNLSFLFPVLEEDEFKNRLDELSREAEIAAEERLNESLKSEEKKIVDEEKELEDDFDDAWFDEKWGEISAKPIKEIVL